MSHSTTSSPLRRLAEEYAEGRLERAAYLEQRRRFLDSLTMTPPRSAPVARAPGLAAAPSRALKRPPWLQLVGAGITLPLAALLWYGLRGGGEAPTPNDTPVVATAPPGHSGPAPGAVLSPGPRPPDPAAASGAGPATATEPAPAHPARDSRPAAAAPDALALIEELLRDGRWGTSERSRFSTAWHQQSAAAQTQARTSVAFQRLEEELTSLIDAERAAGVGEPAEPGLLAFARDIGIDLPPPPPRPAPTPTPAAAGPASTGPASTRASTPGGPGETAAAADDSTRAPPTTDEQRPAVARGASAGGGEREREPPAPPRSIGETATPASTADSAQSTAELHAAGAKPGPVPTPTPVAGPVLLKAAPPEPVEPSLAQRLSPQAGGEPCASAAGRTRAAVYDCLDPFASSGTSGLKLKAIPAETPFAITIEQHDLDKWCARDPSPCAAGADTQAMATAYSAWLKGKTGKTYRPATSADLQQAAAYGITLPQERHHAIRLVRELGLPESQAETLLLERWWRQNRRAPP